MNVETVRLPNDEIATRGDAYYEHRIRSLVESGNQGKVVAIDVLTGAYAVGDDVVAASNALAERQPAAEVWLIRIGRKALHRIGRDRQQAPNRAITDCVRVCLPIAAVQLRRALTIDLM